MKDLQDFEFDLSQEHENAIDHTVISFWIPVGAKEKFDLIQAKSKRKFGKHLKSQIMRSIEKIKLEGA